MRDRSMRQQGRHGHLLEQMARCAAEHPFAHARMAIAADHDHVGTEVGRTRQQLVADACEIDVALSTYRQPVRGDPGRGRGERRAASPSSGCSQIASKVTRFASPSSGSASRSARAASRVSFQPISALLPIDVNVPA